jgi:hypothetical protein
VWFFVGEAAQTLTEEMDHVTAQRWLCQKSQFDWTSKPQVLRGVFWELGVPECHDCCTAQRR